MDIRGKFYALIVEKKFLQNVTVPGMRRIKPIERSSSTKSDNKHETIRNTYRHWFTSKTTTYLYLRLWPRRHREIITHICGHNQDEWTQLTAISHFVTKKKRLFLKIDRKFYETYIVITSTSKFAHIVLCWSWPIIFIFVYFLWA